MLACPTTATAYTHFTARSQNTQPQRLDLLSIDYAQGSSDINFVFFYRPSKRNKRPIPVNIIKDALRKALLQFPELLGRIVMDAVDGQWKLVLDPRNPNWPDITEVSAKRYTLAELRHAKYLWKKWPQETQTVDLCERSNSPVFGLHIVRYACGGVSLHTKVRHQVMDGCGIWAFFGAWAELCRRIIRKPAKSKGAGPAREPPVYNRLVVVRALSSSSSSVCESATAAEIVGQLVQFLERVHNHQRTHNNTRSHTHTTSSSRMHRLALTHSSLLKLKLHHGQIENCTQAHRGYLNENKITFVSTNDLVCALFWRAIARAHMQLYPDDPYTCVMLACDVRRRIGIPPQYTGNLSFPLIAHMTKSQILWQSLTETATYIRQLVNNVSAAFVREMLDLMASEALMQRLIGIFDQSVAFFSASVINRFPMFEAADFGFGRPTHVDIPEYLEPGFSIWMPAASPVDAYYVNIALHDSMFELMRADSELKMFVDIVR
ncbi:hypothetical protein GGI07_004874 [Coemansia sp. Benny D115]|nr:hypothetical protein GGI07_004874 [Coemansia sp. Benny D115]